MVKKYKVWIDDNMEPLNGFWWHCYLDENECLQDLERKDKTPDTLQWHLDNGYIVLEDV